MIIRSIASGVVIGVLSGAVGNLEAATEPRAVKLDLADARFIVQTVPGSGDVQIDSGDAVRPVKLKRKGRTSDEGSKVVKIRVRGTRHRDRGTNADGPRRRLDTIHVSIPRDHPLDLQLIVHRGESDIDLGGLTLTGLRVEMFSGDHDLNFGQPLRGDLNQVTARASRGEFELTGLANLRAREFLFKGSAGEWELDFDGEWDDAADLIVRLHASMGDLSVRLPRDVRLLKDSSSRALMGDSAKHEIARAISTGGDSGPGVLLKMRMTMGDSSLSRF